MLLTKYNKIFRPVLFPRFKPYFSTTPPSNPDANPKDPNPNIKPEIPNASKKNPSRKGITKINFMKTADPKDKRNPEYEFFEEMGSQKQGKPSFTKDFADIGENRFGRDQREGGSERFKRDFKPIKIGDGGESRFTKYNKWQKKFNEDVSQSEQKQKNSEKSDREMQLKKIEKTSFDPKKFEFTSVSKLFNMKLKVAQPEKLEKEQEPEVKEIKEEATVSPVVTKERTLDLKDLDKLYDEKRRNTIELLKEYNSEEADSKTVAFDSYFKKSAQEEQVKRSRSNYQISNYLKGEEGIDYINIPQQELYYWDNLINYAKESFECKINQFLGLNHFSESMKKVVWKHDKEHMHLMESMNSEDVKIYPGNPKGETPESDPNHFIEWYLNSIPFQLYNALEELASNVAISDSTSGGTASSTKLATIETAVAVGTPNWAVLASTPEDELQETSNHLVARSGLDSDKVEPYPEQECLIWDDNVWQVQKWAFFRAFPNFLRAMEYLMKGQVENDNREIITPSLLRYYNTLPEFARESRLVKKMVRAFEFTKHEMSIEQKELALNYICRFTLPMDIITERVCRQAIVSTKYVDYDLLNAELEGEVDFGEDGLVKKKKDPLQEIPKKSNIDVFSKEAWDDTGYRTKKVIPRTEEERIELLEREANLKNPYFDACFYYDIQPTPSLIDPDVPEEDPGPNFPLEYYDNDDGFWESYIKKKESKYDEYKMISYRPYFKH